MNYNNNKYYSHLLPLITPEMLTRYPDQTCEILNKLIRMQGSVVETSSTGDAPGNLVDIEQTTTSYDDGGVNIVTAYLSDGTTSDFQIRNGRQGSQGDPGPAGQDGADGAPGADGFSPIATVTKSGDTATISITDANGTTTATVTDGADGAAGQAATIAVGSTSTLPEGSSATVTNSGTSSAAVFDFGIPKGDKGDTGATGPANTLSIGTVVSGATADATITGTAPNQTLNLVLPKGDPGTPANVVNSYSTSTTDAYSASYVNGVIPTVNDATLTIEQNGVTAGTFTANSSSSTTVSLTDTTYSNFVGTDGVNAGSAGLVPAPTTSDGSKYLKGDGTWAATPPIELVEMVYGESNAWQKFINAYNNKCIVYCRASSNANPASGAKTRKAFMAYVNNETTPTQVEFQYVRSISSHSDTQQGDQVFVYLLKNTSGGTWSVTTREMSTKIVAGTNMTSSYSSGTLTLNATQPTVNDSILTIEQNGVSMGTFTANASSNATISLTDTTYSDFAGATSSIAGSAGLVPAPAAGDDTKFLAGDGTWKTSGGVANDGTLTIQKNSTTVGTFTANQSTNTTVDISVPTQFSDLSGTIGTSQIANDSVTADKIDWSTIAPEWETFYFTYNGTDEQQTVTTRKGTTLTVQKGNAGTLYSITSGGSNIMAIRQRVGSMHSATTGNYGVNGVATNTTVYTREISGISNGTKRNVSETSHTTGSYNYCDIVTSAGNKNGFQMFLEGHRYSNTTDSDMWSLKVYIGSNNVNTFTESEVRCKAMSADVVPTCYQRSVSGTEGYCILEILEV